MAFLRLTLCMLIIVSCAENNPRPASRSLLFSGEDSFGKTWQIDAIEIELGTLIPKPCVTDNFITYYPNGIYEINEGATKCSPGDPPGISGTWYLNETEEKLIVTIGDSTQVWDIDETKSESHQITSLFIEGNRTYTLTLSK